MDRTFVITVFTTIYMKHVTYLKVTQDALTIFHMNVRSLSNSLYKLEDFLLAIEHCPDIIAITETK